MTSTHRYPLSWVLADYARGGAGLALTGLPLVLIGPAPIFAYILGALALAFIVFLARTALRHRTAYHQDTEGLSAIGPLDRAPGRRIDWRDLNHLALRYYSTQRNRENGWLQLTLKSADGTALRLESPLEGFGAIVERAVTAAQAAGVALDETTVANMRASGYRLSQADKKAALND
ncbi:MAG: hypothetical protein AAFW76_00740 [Pseudomonadota bacterium]